MRSRDPSQPESYAGSLLLAHPALRDPNFKRTVVLMTSHAADGAMGVVLNRPLHRQLGQLGGDFALGPLAGVPIFNGGPVQQEQLIIAAWRVHPSGFQLHLGIEPEKAVQLLAEDGMHVRAFFGYSGWSGGQLETELRGNTWIVAQPPPDLFAQPGDKGLWRSVLLRAGPEWQLLADEPEEPGEN
ncbi:MAG TPA: YqgE/AlgH family protein [Opitutaceae bacterium]|nr:YqgE/AlgH family protein [Opitutaceae bacterium]